MGKRRRGRKITGKDPSKTLPKSGAPQEQIEAGGRDFPLASRHKIPRTNSTGTPTTASVRGGCEDG